jgi:hypothetical protein
MQLIIYPGANYDTNVDEVDYEKYYPPPESILPLSYCSYADIDHVVDILKIVQLEYMIQHSNSVKFSHTELEQILYVSRDWTKVSNSHNLNSSSVHLRLLIFQF